MKRCLYLCHLFTFMHWFFRVFMKGSIEKNGSYVVSKVLLLKKTFLPLRFITSGFGRTRKDLLILLLGSDRESFSSSNSELHFLLTGNLCNNSKCMNCISLVTHISSQYDLCANTVNSYWQQLKCFADPVTTSAESKSFIIFKQLVD